MHGFLDYLRSVERGRRERSSQSMAGSRARKRGRFVVAEREGK